ncbi:MAG: GTP pyrophosphokinase [Alphaproteobacteria bacterium]
MTKTESKGERAKAAALADPAMSTLERALAFAVAAHAGQRDKSGAPYVLHPLRLMLAMETDEERLAALLHDTVEDCEGVDFATLAALGLPDTVLAALRLLTHDDDTPYEDYVRRINADPLARRVKLADLRDNMNAARLTRFEAKDAERMTRYVKAHALLNGDG